MKEIKKSKAIAKLLTRPGVIAAVILALGGILVLASIQRGLAQRAETEPKTADGGNVEKKELHDNYVTVTEEGGIIVLNRKTGETRGLTGDEAKRLADGLKQLLNRSTEGLVEVHHSNGGVSIDLQGRFQDVILAKKDEDGQVAQSCVDNPESAAAFFDIDPVLIGSAAARKPAVRTDVNGLPIE